MVMNTRRRATKLGCLSQVNRRGLTLVNMLAALFIIFGSLMPAVLVTSQYGVESGLFAGTIASLGCWGVIIALSAWSHYQFHETLRTLSENYPSIYRVKRVPVDTSRFWMAEGATIEIGDYGWEAKPLHDDGLIYLQGLSERWGVVWYGGFRLDEIEEVGPKPRTQYLLPESWYLVGPDAFPCPFPVQSRQSADLGMPQHGRGLDFLPERLRKAKDSSF